jgi:hypothetical protein
MGYLRRLDGVYTMDRRNTAPSLALARASRLPSLLGPLVVYREFKACLQSSILCRLYFSNLYIKDRTYWTVRALC